MSSPSFAGAIGGFFESRANQMFTSIPAVVVGVKSLSEKRIDVQPSIMMRTKDGATGSELPSILNVPLQMPCTSQGGLTYPISVGDTVLLVFSQRGIDTWKRGGGGMATPSNLRTFDAQDAVAIAGVHPFTTSPNANRANAHSPDDVVLVHGIGSGAETEVRLLKGGGVVVNTSQNVEVNCTDAEVNSDSFTVNSDSFSVNSSSVDFSSSSFNIGTGSYSMSATESATSTGTFSHNGSWVLNGKNVDGHTHPNVQSGGDNTGAF